LGAALLLAAAACDRPSNPVRSAVSSPARVSAPPRPVEPEALAAAACHERAQGVQSWLREVDALGWPLGASLLDGGARLVARTGPSLDEPAPVVHLAASEQAVDGFRVSDLPALGERLSEVLELRRRTMEASPFLANPRVYFAIDADVPWSRVVAAAERVGAAGFERAAFVFADPARVPPPLPPSTIDADLAKLASASAQKRSAVLAESLAFVYKGCPSALQVIGQFGHDVAEVQQALVEQLPSALEFCHCAVDDASVRSLHWALFGNPRPGSAVTVTLAIASGPSNRVVKAPAEAQWKDAHALLVPLSEAASERLVLSVEAPVPPPTPSDAAVAAKRGPKKVRP